jgi:hypothetical protein
LKFGHGEADTWYAEGDALTSRETKRRLHPIGYEKALFERQVDARYPVPFSPDTYDSKLEERWFVLVDGAAEMGVRFRSLETFRSLATKTQEECVAEHVPR